MMLQQITPSSADLAKLVWVPIVCLTAAVILGAGLGIGYVLRKAYERAAFITRMRQHDLHEAVGEDESLRRAELDLGVKMGDRRRGH